MHHGNRQQGNHVSQHSLHQYSEGNQPETVSDRRAAYINTDIPPADLELIAKLDQERMLEEQSADSKSLPEKLEDDLKASGFRVG